ncbi:DUF4172 domain-containing protein [Maridesulfovibrio sp.]
MWIHEHQDWPNFSWNAEKLISKLADNTTVGLLC